MKTKPKVSIIIRTKNEEMWIENCLKKVFDQTYKEIEVIIVDNESSDNTLEIVQKFEVKVINIKNFIPGKALNDGIKVSSGEIIVCLSAHCIPCDQNWLEKIIDPLSNTKIAGCYGRQKPLPYSSVFDKRDLLTTFGLDPKIQKKDPFFHNANSALRKELWERFPFDETVTNVEDRVWAKKILSEGFNIFYEPEASVFHYHGINQDMDPERCASVVKIMENLFENKDSENNGSSLSINLSNISVCAIIPIKGKLIMNKDICLLEYTANNLKKSKYIKSTYVVTDNEDTAKTAKSFGLSVPFLRPKNLSDDLTDIITVAKYAIKEIEKNEKKYQLVMILTENYPFREAKFFDNMIEKLIHSGLSTLIAASNVRTGIWLKDKYSINKRKLINSFTPNKFKNELTLLTSIGLGCLTYKKNIVNGNIYGDKFDFYITDSPLSMVEITKTDQLEVLKKITEFGS